MGVGTAVASYERGQDLKRYADASYEAHLAASVGAKAASTGQRLLAVHGSMSQSAIGLRQALVDGDEQDYASQAKQLNVDNLQARDLRAEMMTFTQELDRAAAGGSIATPGNTPDAPADTAPPVVFPGTGAPIRTVCLDVEGTFEGQPVTLRPGREGWSTHAASRLSGPDGCRGWHAL